MDDNATNRTILREQLRSWGCVPEEAPDGESALVKLREAVDAHSPFDIAILDMVMPDIGGAMLGRTNQSGPETLCNGAGHADFDWQSWRRQEDAGDRVRSLSHQTHKGFATARLPGAGCFQEATGSKTQPMPIVTRHSVAEDRKRRIRILLAEDNMINQELALRHPGKVRLSGGCGGQRQRGFVGFGKRFLTISF